MSNDSSVLTLTGAGVPPYSARGLRQSLTPIEASAAARRTVNGTLVDLSASQFRKYASRITCRDMTAPALDGIWPGQILTVECVAELAYEDTTDGAAQRTAVAGSQRTEAGFVFYRPQLTMMVTGFETDFDEWGAECGWTLDLEEV